MKLKTGVKGRRIVRNDRPTAASGVVPLALCAPLGLGLVLGGTLLQTLQPPL